MQVGRVEADHAGQRLAVGEAAVRRHQPVGVARGDFDMIAEHGIVADLERRDPGRLAVARLERGDRAAPVARRAAQGVERGVIALGDIAALGRVERRRRRPARSPSSSVSAAWPPSSGSKRGEQVGASALPPPARPCSAALAISPSRSGARSRGLPRPATSRASARPMSGIARSASRTRSRRSGSSWNHCTSASRASIARAVGQRRGQVGGQQPPPRRGDAAVDRRRAGCPPRSPSACGRSRGCRASPGRSPSSPRARSGAARRGTPPPPSASRRDRPASPPAAASSARPGDPNPSSVADPEPRLQRALARQAVEPALAAGRSRSPAPCRRRSSRPGPAAPARTSARPARTRPARTARSKCPPRRSPIRRRPGATAASQLAAAAVEQASPRSASPASPAARSRGRPAPSTPRALRASAGLSICSAMATRCPARISRAR